MSLLSGPEIRELFEQGVIENGNPEDISASSFDIRLGSKILTEQKVSGFWGVVDLAEKESPQMIEQEINPELGYLLAPKEFILAQTQEVFNLPSDISMDMKLRSSMARAGLGHALAGHADAGWNGSVLTLELRNDLRYHTLRLRVGLRVAQMLVFRHKDAGEYCYSVRGNYNNNLAVTAAFQSETAK